MSRGKSPASCRPPAPRVVDVVGLAESRLPELRLLLANDDGHVGPPPRHLRRRASAHSRRHRSRPRKVEPKDGDKEASRKRRRRPQALLESHDPHGDDENESGASAGTACGGSGGGVRWLETHIWHAKRMHFAEEPLWGWKLPLNRSDQGCAAALRSTEHGCTSHDATYSRPIEIRGLRLGQILALVRRLGDTGAPALTGGVAHEPQMALAVLQGTCETSMLVHGVDRFPRDLLGPARLLLDKVGEPGASACAPAAISDEDAKQRCAQLLSSPQPRRLWLWCHPAMICDTQAALVTLLGDVGSGMMGKPSGGGAVRLELRGRESLRILNRMGLTSHTSARLERCKEGDIIGTYLLITFTQYIFGGRVLYFNVV